MRSYAVEIISRTDGGGMSLVLVDTPRWTRWLISAGYCVMRATGDKHGIELVGRAYRIYDRHARTFELPSAIGDVEEFRRWIRAGGGTFEGSTTGVAAKQSKVQPAPTVAEGRRRVANRHRMFNRRRAPRL